MKSSPYSHEVIGALRNMLAPGGRMRISPYVEGAQFSVLFGRKPDPGKRAKDSRTIIEENLPKIEDIVKYWAQFKTLRNRFSSGEYQSNVFLDAYLAYYFTTNVCKLQLCLLEALRNKALRGNLSVIDLGVGTGTTAVAFIDFLISWSHACDLFGAEFPVDSFDFKGFDINPDCLEMSGKVLSEYAGALNERVISFEDAEEGAPAFLKKAEKWALGATWEHCAVANIAPSEVSKFSVLVASYVLNEMEDQDKTNLENILAAEDGPGLALILEPGDRDSTHQLNRWRRNFLSLNPTITPIAPCGSEFGAVQSAKCGSCWNARRESLHQTELFKRFRDQATSHLGQNWDRGEFENNLLSWSYVILRRGTAEAGRPPSLAYDLDEGVVSSRYIGRYSVRAIDREVELRSCEPEERSHEWEISYREYFKLCPRVVPEEDVLSLMVERCPGYEMPRLEHGDSLIVRDMVIDRGTHNIYLRHDFTGNGASAGMEISLPERQIEDKGASFLRVYDNASRKAVDEFAFREFGFPRMYGFQHDILGRVLTGNSIMAIAATGAGKSECFIMPALALPGVVIVISPLKSLMQDQYDKRICERFGLESLVTYINGDVPFHTKRARLKRLELGYYKLIYFTPEQLRQGHVLDSLRIANEKVGVRYIAFDEAHCISQWGHDFRDSYLNLVHRLKDWGIDPVRIALTATASPQVREDVCDELGLTNKPFSEGGDVLLHAANRPELNFIVKACKSTEDKVKDLVERLRVFAEWKEGGDDPGSAIVFMPHTGQLKDFSNKLEKGGRLVFRATDFAAYLERLFKTRVSLYHSKMDYDEDGETNPTSGDNRQARYGDMRNRKRRTEQNAFMDNDKRIIVATKGFGMGIDKDNVRLIAHRTPPANLEAYAQEAGRAGRDGMISDVVLYYSPDNIIVAMAGDKRIQQSDRGIQEFFLREKYIRRQDVTAIAEFLRALKPLRTGYLYFTNDQAIDFLDRNAARLGFTWPDFPERVFWADAYGRHATLLDKGHIYQEKTKYVSRILSAVYRIRPDTEDFGPRLSFLESFQETDAMIKGLTPVRNAMAIVCSNSYYGSLLRDKGIDSDSLLEWLKGCELESTLGFADFLGLSPSDTASLLRDIQRDGFFDKDGNWTSTLLEFRLLGTPLLGPAAGKTELSDWREYAGAVSRASKKDLMFRRARMDGRSTPSEDDWFGWRELPKSKGWEVKPGAALMDKKRFDAFLEGFVTLHNRRERNDRQAYRLLLSDYVGVDDNGNPKPDSACGCLRAVLLGYLKTGEAIQGGNCLSCVRCVPSGKFEISMEKRQEVVVHLGIQLLESLEEIEDSYAAIPEEVLLDRLWKEVEEKERAGVSVIDYLVGLTGRLITDSPGHKAGLWVRLTGMTRGSLDLDEREYLDDMQSLLEDCEGSELRRLWDLASEAHLLVQQPETIAMQARIAHKLKDFQEEEHRWLMLVESEESGLDFKHNAHLNLAELYSAGSPLANGKKHREQLLRSARTAPGNDSALKLYAGLTPEWNARHLGEEIQLIEGAGNLPGLADELISQWLRRRTPLEKIELGEKELIASSIIQSLWTSLEEEECPGDFLKVLKEHVRNWATSLLGEGLRHKSALFLLISGPSLGHFSLGYKHFAELAQAALDTFTSEDLEIIWPYLEKAHIVFPNDAAVLELQAQALYLLTRYDEAEKLWESCCGDQADVPVETHERAIAGLMDLYIEQGRWDKVFSRLDSTLEDDKSLATLESVIQRLGYSDQRVEELGTTIRRNADIEKLEQRIANRYIPADAPSCLTWLELFGGNSTSASKENNVHVAELCFNDIHQKSDRTLLLAFKDVISRHEPLGGTKKLMRISEMMDLLRACEKEMEIMEATNFTRKLVDGIISIFQPASSPQRADMAAALFFFLPGKNLDEEEMLLEMYIQCLCYARRYPEALDANRRHLRFGKERVPLAEYINGLLGEERDRPSYEKNYTAVIEIMAAVWNIR